MIAAIAYLAHLPSRDWMIVLALTFIGVALGVNHVPGAGLFIAAAIVVAAAND